MNIRIKTRNTKLNNSLIYLISVYFILITVYHIINIFKLNQNPTFTIIIILLSGLLFSLAINIKTNKRFTIPNYIKILSIFIICFLPKYIFLINNLYTPISDFGYYYYSALRFSRREVFEAGPYMLIVAPNTLGFVTYLGYMFKLFGEGTYLPLLLNLIYTGFSGILIYCIAKRFISDTFAYIGALIFSLSPSMFFYCVNLSSEPLPLFLSLLSIAIYLYANEKSSNQKLFYYSICALLLAIAFIMRANSMVFFVAIILYELIYTKNNGKKLINILTLLLFFGVIYLSFKYYQKTIFKIDMPSAIGWPLYEGLDITTYGTWSAENRATLFELIDNRSPNEVQPELLRLAIERMKSYSFIQIIDLILGKGVRTWLFNSYSTIILNYDGISKEIYSLTPYLHQFLNAFYQILFFMYIISNCALIVSKRINYCCEQSFILLLPIALTIFTHSFFTSIDRYHYNIIPIMTILLFFNIHLLRESTAKLQSNNTAENKLL